MRQSIDFGWIKDQVSFELAFELLDYAFKHEKGDAYRGQCPACGGSDRALVYTPGEGFTCHALGKGTEKGFHGDQIAFTAHIMDIGQYDAARELAQRAGVSFKPTGTVRTSKVRTSTVPRRATEPESERVQKPRSSRGGGAVSSPPRQRSQGFDHEEYASKLDFEHELLIDASADPDKMRAYGIGYSTRGTHSKRIAVRVYDPETGDFQFIGIGADGSIHLPPTLKSSVIVPLKRRA